MDNVMEAIREESARAEARYGEPASAQESLGVLLEEFNELAEAIHANHRGRVEHEAIQVASVAHRLALACYHGGNAFITRSGMGHDR